MNIQKSIIEDIESRIDIIRCCSYYIKNDSDTLYFIDDKLACLPVLLEASREFLRLAPFIKAIVIVTGNLTGYLFVSLEAIKSRNEQEDIYIIER